MEKIIKLINSKNGWLARFIDDQEVIEAFGTDTLRTPFNETTYPMEVKRTIERLNPDYRVIFG